MTLVDELAEKYPECAEVFYEKALVHKSLGLAREFLYKTFIFNFVITNLKSFAHIIEWMLYNFDNWIHIRMLDAARKDALFAMALNEKAAVNNAELRGQLDELLDEISK